ncbi:MAG: hypothetical protein H6730_07280 [Deltaproteobacteria bacterium]|nr:hypothetical protein [Deltaproteobacteria bacterium]
MQPCLLALWLLAQPDPGAMEQAAQRAVEALTLPTRPGFGGGVAVLVTGDAGSDALAARLAGQLRALGVGAPAVLPTQARLTGLDPQAARAARDAGAEWLVWVEARRGPEGTVILQASLLDVDPEGLWGAPPGSPASLALATVATPGPASTPPPPPPPPAGVPGLHPAGDPAVALELPERVLDLAPCPAPDGAPEALAVLTEGRLVVLAATQGNLHPELELDLSRLPRAPRPAREPVGQVVCSAETLAFGHSGLATGHLVRRAAPGAPWGTFAGLPHGFGPDGGLVTGALEAGTNRLAADETGEAAYQRLVVAGAPPGWARLTVSTQYHLQAAEAPATAGPAAAAPDLDPELSIGVGLSARVVGQGLLLVGTAPPGLAAKSPGTDQVRVWRGPPLEPLSPWTAVPGSVQASAVLRLFPDRRHVALAAWRPERGRSTLWLWALEGTP